MRVRSPAVLRQCSVVFWRTCRCNVFVLASTAGKVIGKPFLISWVDVCVEYFVYE